MDADGKVSMAVTHARDAKGNAIANAEATAVGAETANAVMKDVAKETAEKDPSAMQNAIENTEGGKEAASKAVAQNIATSIDFSKAGTEGQDSVAEMVINNVLDNADDAKNGAVIDNAMLAFLQDPANKKIMKEFQKLTGLSDADMQNQDLVLKNIDILRAGGTGIKQLGITADSYKDKMGGALEQAVQNGDYSISAWELFNSQKDGAAEAYIDQVSAENMVRNNDEVELEKEKSAEGLEAMIQKLVEQLLNGKDYAAIAKAEYDKEHGAGSFDKLDQAEKDKLVAATETKEKEQAEAQARGQALFTAFTQNADGNSVAVNEMLKAAMGIDSEAGVQTAIGEAIKAGGVSNKDVDELNKVNGYNNEDIAQAIKSLQLLGQDVSKENIAAYLERAKADPDAHNKELLEAMQSDTTGAVDKSKMYQMLGGGDLIDEEQRQKLAEQTAANGMMALDAADQEKVKENLAQAEFGKAWQDLTAEEQAKITEKANGLSLYEAQAVAAGKSQQEAFTELREESKKRKVIDEALASNPDIPVEQLIEAAGNDPETAKYIQEMYAQRMSVVGDADKAEAQKEAEAEVIAEQTKDSKGKGADITTEAGRKEAYRRMVGGNPADADAKLNFEVESKFAAKIKDKIGTDKDLQAQRDAWLKANPNKTQDDFVTYLATQAKSGDKATLQALGYVDAKGNADKTKLDAERAEFEREVVVGMAKETYDGFDADVAESASKKVEAKNRELIESGKGAEILKTAEILDKGNASGTYGKFVQEANLEYQRLYGKDKNLANEDPLARAAFLTQYMQKRGFTLEADDVQTVKKAGEQAKATGKSAADKAEAELLAKNPNATKTEIAEARQNAAIFAQIASNPAQFGEMISVMESYDGGEKGNAVALKLKRSILEKTYDDYKSKGVTLSIAKDPEKMSADERKRFEFNKGILQQEMRNNNDVVGNLFKNTNIFNQEAMIQAIAQSSGMKFDENMGAWVGADGKALTDEKGNKIGKDNMLALKSHLDNGAIANYMNSHEDAKDKLLNLGAQNMMLTMNKETQDIKKADAVLSSSYLRNEVSTKVLMDAGLNDANGKLDENKVMDLIKQMLKASGRDAEASDENIKKNIDQYKTELALHSITKDGNGNFVVGGRDANAFVKATTDLESDPKFATALNREVTRVIDPASYDPETSTKEFFASHSISDFRADDGSEIHNLADALNAFHKEGFGGFKKGAKNIVGDAKGGMTEGGLVGGFKTMFLGGYGEGNKHGGIVGNDGERGGIVGGLESIAVKGVLGSARNLLTLKGIRAAHSAIKESKQIKLDNGRDISYIKYKTGGYELDENGKVKRDERGKAILTKKHKLSGAEEQFAKEQFAKDQYAKEQFESKHGVSAAEVGHAQASYAKEQYARENFAREQFAKEQYAREKFEKMADANGKVHGQDFEQYYERYGQSLLEGFGGAGDVKKYSKYFSQADIAQYSGKFNASNLEQFSKGFDENNIEMVKQHSAGFDISRDTAKYAADFANLDEGQKKKYSTNFGMMIGADATYTAGFDASKVEQYSAGFDSASSTLKQEYAAGLKSKVTVSRQEVVEEKAKKLYAQEAYAREKYKQINGTDSGFAQLTEAQKATYYEAFDKLDESSQSKYSAGFETSSKKQDFIDIAEKKVTKKDVEAATEAATKARTDSYAKKSAVEKRARETFAQDEYAKEQYAKEHGSTEGFDKLSAAEKSQYTAGYAKLSKKEQAKYAAEFDKSADKQAYMTAAEGSVTAKEIEAAGKVEKNAEYVSGFKRFRRVSNAVLDNTAIGTLLKQPLIGVAKMGTGIGLGVGKMGTGIGLGVARMATKAWTSTVGNAHSFVTRNRRLFGSNNTEMLEMVQEARKDKLIMKEVGENASTADIARYLDKNKVAGENIKNRVHAKKARELANADATFADELIKAGVDLTDDAAVAEHLSKNKTHRERVNKSFKYMDDSIAVQKARELANTDATFANELKNAGVDINDDKAILQHLSINGSHREKVQKAAGLNFESVVQSDSRMNTEAKQHAYSNDELAAKIKAKKVEVDVSDEEVAAQALKSSYIKAKLGANATMEDVQAYLDSHKADKDKFTVAAKVQAIRDGRAGTVAEANGKKVKVENVLDKMLLVDKKATTSADGTVVANADVVKDYFKA
ncbi:MAG: hypothetical protein IJA23_04455, partial [Clostridia bacterium]|nr:hypothetical protein [Clostridia bacterium]